MTAIPQRRGVALILAMIAIGVVTTIGAGALMRASSASTSLLFQIQDAESRLVLDGLAPRLTAWIEAIADKPDAAPAMDGGFVNLYEEDRGELRVIISAIDLSGRLHYGSLATFAARGLPPDLQRTGERAVRTLSKRAQRSRQPPLLEELAAIGSDDGVRVFPSSVNDSIAHDVALCQWLTTQGDGALNINSAPPELLQAALRGLAPSLARRAVASRQSGERVDGDVAMALLAQRARASSTEPQASRYVPLTTRSSVWGFLVRIEHAGRKVRWWLVAQPDRNGLSRGTAASTNWVIVQRRRIEL